MSKMIREAAGWEKPAWVAIRPDVVLAKAVGMGAEECKAWVVATMASCISGEREEGSDADLLLREAMERIERKRRQTSEAGKASGNARRTRAAEREFNGRSTGVQRALNGEATGNEHTNTNTNNALGDTYPEEKYFPLCVRTPEASMGAFALTHTPSGGDDGVDLEVAMGHENAPLSSADALEEGQRRGLDAGEVARWATYYAASGWVPSRGGRPMSRASALASMARWKETRHLGKQGRGEGKRRDAKRGKRKNVYVTADGVKGGEA